jgi:peptidyl-prolyl cis-trans isomerase SurA
VNAIKYQKNLLAKIILLGAVALTGSSLAMSQDYKLVDEVVAIVDDDVILGSEMVERMQSIAANLQRNQKPVPDNEQLQKQTLDLLILENLQLQVAERAGARVSDAELNQALANIAKQNNMTLEQFSQAVSQSGDSYEAMREQIRKDLLIRNVQQGVVGQKVQVTPQEVDGFLKSAEGKSMIQPEYRVWSALVPVASDANAASKSAAKQKADALRQATLKNGPALNPGEGIEAVDLGWRPETDLPSIFSAVVPKLKRGEVSQVFESPNGFHIIELLDVRGRNEKIRQTRARHILLKSSAIRDEAQTEQLASELRKRFLAGEDFRALAKQYSEDIGSAMEGGELGWINPGQMVPEFQEAMDKTDLKAISQPFKSQFGWHIVDVEERREQDMTDTMRRKMAENYLFQRKYQDELQLWQGKIRDEAYVDIKMNKLGAAQ